METTRADASGAYVNISDVASVELVAQPTRFSPGSAIRWSKRPGWSRRGRRRRRSQEKLQIGLLAADWSSSGMEKTSLVLLSLSRLQAIVFGRRLQESSIHYSYDWSTVSDGFGRARLCFLKWSGWLRCEVVVLSWIDKVQYLIPIGELVLWWVSIGSLFIYC